MENLNLQTVLDFLGTDNETRIKQVLTDLVIDNLSESISKEWFVCPDTLNNAMEECFEKVFKKYKKEITKAMEQRFEKLIKDILAEEAKQVEQTD